MQEKIPLTTFNNLPDGAAATALLQCCSAQRWVERMLMARPFADEQHLIRQASHCWQSLQEPDYLQAFAGHPKIGDIHSLREKYASTKILASGEQAGVGGADESMLERLSQGNRDYEEKFGFIFIVCATGKSAGEMLALLETRLPNTRDEEINNACNEQEKITAIRLHKLFSV